MKASEEERGPLRKKVKFGEGTGEGKKKRGLPGPSAPSTSANERLIKQWRGMDGQEDLRTKLKINDSIAALVGLIGTMVAIVENNILFDETPVKPRYVQNSACKAMRAVQTVTTVILGKVLGIMI